ncbi:hypothetical protein M099_2801 [Phocaeicola vulgatus str. 3975 RP4]|uniref:Uncharacterized protein n=2 Tax=Phocaeicola vulgatus TaxID=821 RepID=A0A078QMI3_PHOVU|nr:hypothetical protein M097_4622 [Phocaeicola vulgatus str. 3775 SL(B) 10 (iv)]KDS53028.1 hypothetical protein M099_2801 [Phocaeicola vulgatus str. 3975 RP4]
MLSGHISPERMGCNGSLLHPQKKIKAVHNSHKLFLSLLIMNYFI